MSGRDLSTSRTQVFGDVAKGTECRVCGRDVEDGRAKFCSRHCRSLATAVMDLLNWSGVRRIVIDRDDGTCQECGFLQEWTTAASAHVRDIIDEKLPERPDGPSLEAVGADGYDDVDWEGFHRESEAWRRAKARLRERYGNPLEAGRGLEVDHIRELADGGHPFALRNLRTLCEDCHRRKTAERASERADTAESAADRPEKPLREFVVDSVSPN